MSHAVNDQILENAQASFESSKNGFERVAILKDLLEGGFTESVEYLKGSWYIQRAGWLEEYGVKESDIMIDDEGQEFYMDIDESGAPGCDYQVDKIKCKIPWHLNVDYWVA